MNFKSGLLLVAILAVSNFASYYYGSQKPAEIRTVEREVIKKDVITRIVEVIKPDGSKEIKTIVIDKSTETTNKKTDVMPQRPKDWLVGAYYKVNNPAYGASINRRILGPLFLQVAADTGRNLTVGLGMEF